MTGDVLSVRHAPCLTSLAIPAVRLWRAQKRVRVLKFFQLRKKPVELRVRDDRVILHIVKIIVPVYFVF